MKNITILLPIYKLEKNETLMLSKALKSVEPFHNDVNLSIICPPKIKEKLKDYDFGQKLIVNVIENKTNNTNFQAQVNIGIDKCETEWFSILEIDDTYNPNWFKLMNEHIKSKPDLDILLPIVRDINDEGKFISFTNESVWAYGFTEELGKLNHETLLEFQNYQTSGALYKTEVIKKYGGFKDNIDLTFSYEFLLRMAYNGVIIGVAPKVGYEHVLFREGSLFWMLKNDEKIKLDEKQIKYWIETAKNEYFFKNKRDLEDIK